MEEKTYALLAHGVYDVFPVPERTKESRFLLLNACAQASCVQFMLRSPGVERNELSLLWLDYHLEFVAQSPSGNLKTVLCAM